VRGGPAFATGGNGNAYGAEKGKAYGSDNGNAYGQASAALPGESSSGNGGAQSFLVRCENWPATSSADIGPNGGIITVGRARLIIPPGALSDVVHVTGTALPDDNPTVAFQPSGLEFKKPAGLQFDVTGCEIPADSPDIVYLNDAGEIVERIEAVYSNYWRQVAAPVRHFSNYALAY